MRRIGKRLWLGGLVALGVGCGGAGDTNGKDGGSCFTVGCASLVTLSLTTPLTSGRHEITLTGAGFPSCIIDFAQSDPWTLCAIPGSLTNGKAKTSIDTIDLVFGMNQADGPLGPATVTVSIASNGGAPVTTTHTPTWSDVYPNGKDCPGHCQTTTIVR